MPILIRDGICEGPYANAADAGPCEWCGVPLVRFDAQSDAGDHARPVQFAPDEGLISGGPCLIVVTRMCRECIRIYCGLGRDGIEEMPEGD